MRLCGGEYSRRMFCSNGFDTIHVVFTDQPISAVNTGSNRPLFWKPLCLLSTPDSLATTHKLSTDIDY